MKRTSLAIALLLLAAGSAGQAWADYGHRHDGVRFGITIGSYWGGPWRYPSPYYYYYPPVVIQQTVPQVYVEQVPVPATVPASPPTVTVPAAPPTTTWYYYCAAANGYYPYVRECPGGWQKVLPQPPGQQ